MKILVTGACGFVGKHILNELATAGHEAVGMDVGAAPAQLPPHRFISANITDADAMAGIVANLAPDACLHLAGWSFVGNGNPRTVLDVNLMGTVNLLEAFRNTRSTARILCISSAHVYGMTERALPICEQEPLNPGTFYAVSKAAADQLAHLYAKEYGLAIMVARPNNHIGPGQSPQFAIPSFARQIKAIRKGAPAVIKVGNLDNHRDFTDVRDVARAYRLLLEKGHPGKAYNITSGHEMRVGDILNRLCELAGIKPELVRDPALYRPLDHNPALNFTRLREDTGWTPQIPIDQTLRDILEDS
ncbi:MAG: GDP-mannose 4,6-dehydratase [bacterium]